MNDLLHLVDAPIEGLINGTILRVGEPVYREVSFLRPDDFEIESNRLIFATIQEIASEINPTLEAVAHRLLEREKLEVVGGFAGLMDVEQQAIPGLKLLAFANSLRAKAIDRRAWRLNASLTLLFERGASIASPEAQAVIEDLRLLEPPAGVETGTIARIEDLPAVGGLQEPIAYIREPELQEKSLIGLTGDSGSGKSTLVRAFVRDANANGIPCLILDRESPRQVAADCMERLGMVDSPLLRWWGGWNGDAAPGPSSWIVIEWTKSCVAAGLTPLIVIDSLIAFLGGDENDSNVMRSFMNGARHLADLGATVIVIHHDGKADSARDFRGSSDWKAAVDAAFHVTNISSDGKLDRLNLRCYKSRYGFTGSLVYRYASGLFVRDERIDAPAVVAADQLTAILRTNPGIGTREFEDLAAKANLGRNRARDFLRSGVSATTIRQEKAGTNRHHHYLVEAE